MVNGEWVGRGDEGEIVFKGNLIKEGVWIVQDSYYYYFFINKLLEYFVKLNKLIVRDYEVIFPYLILWCSLFLVMQVSLYCQDLST